MTSTSDGLRARMRKTMIDIARRRQRPGSGSSIEFLRERTAHLKWPDLTGVLSGILWAVAGAVATRRYMPERQTRDLDVVVLERDGAAARRKLRDAGFAFVSELGIGGSSWTTPDGVPIVLIEGRESWWPQAFEAAEANADADGTPVLTLPYLTLMKLLSGRNQDSADVSRMLGLASPEEVERVRSLIRGVAPQESEDLESLIVLGRTETQA